MGSEKCVFVHGWLDLEVILANGGVLEKEAQHNGELLQRYVAVLYL